MFRNNTEYEIMTKNGFENFQGVQKSDSRKVFCVVLEDGTTINCTPNHKFKTPFGFVELTRLFEGDVIETIDGFKVIDRICVNDKLEDVYDVIDAGIDHQYYTNGILSHNCNFVGSTNTLIHPSKIRSLVFNTPIAREGDIHVYEQPVSSHTYVIVADVAEGQGLDYSTFSVIDVTQIPYKQVAKYKNNKISPFLFPTVIYSAAQKYNEAFILVEINSIGLQVADILHNDLAYENLIKVRNGKNKAGQQATPGFTRQMQFGLKTSVQTKKIGCANLKSLIENDKLIINDEDTIMELTTFSASKASFAAEEGNNDDLVMTLVNFGWLTAQKYFKESVNTDIRRTLQEEQMNIMDNDIVPFGAIDNGIDDPWEKQKDKDGDLWFEDRRNRAPFDDLNWDWRAKL